MSRKAIYILTILALVFGMVGFQPAKPVQAANPIRISQAYGGGGNSGQLTPTILSNCSTQATSL